MVVYVTFKINQDEISKTICIQRKVANNTCNGQCELRKSLKKFEDNERKMDTVLKEKSELIYIKPHFDTDFTWSFDSNSSKLMVFHSAEKPISISQLSFRPPTYFI